MTGFPLTLLIACGLCIALGMAVTRRTKRPGIGSGIIITLITVSLGMICATTGFVLVKTAYAQLTLPEYEATITAFESYIDEDSDGNQTLMYRSTIQFTDNSGRLVLDQRPSNTGRQPIIGDTVTIHYGNGELHEPAFWLYATTATFTVVCGYLLTYALFFAANWRRERLLHIGQMGLFGVIIPGALLFMGLAMLWACYDFLFGQNEAELSAGIALVLLGFGSIIMLSFIGYITLYLRRP